MKKAATFFCILISACNQPAQQIQKPENLESSTMQSDHKDELKNLSENRMDPVCGMPVSAGISDTVHFNNKVIGFCSPDCKQAFTENPSGFTLEYKQ